MIVFFQRSTTSEFGGIVILVKGMYTHIHKHTHHTHSSILGKLGGLHIGGIQFPHSPKTKLTRAYFWSCLYDPPPLPPINNINWSHRNSQVTTKSTCFVHSGHDYEQYRYTRANKTPQANSPTPGCLSHHSIRGQKTPVVGIRARLLVTGPISFPPYLDSCFDQQLPETMYARWTTTPPFKLTSDSILTQLAN